MNEQLVTLKNGAEAPEPAVRAIMINLREFMDREPIAFYELVCVCRDPAHAPFGNTGQKLIRAMLLEPDGRPHAVVRDIVLSAVVGEDGGEQLVSPIAGT